MNGRELRPGARENVRDRFVSLESDMAGFARFNLMVGTIFDRLVASEHKGLPGS